MGVPEHLQPLQLKETESGNMSTRSTFPERKILTEMFKYFSILDLQYFWEKQNCISFQSAFSDFQNFVQSYLYFISMYKRQGLSYHHLALLELVATLATRWHHLPLAGTFVLHFNVQMTGLFKRPVQCLKYQHHLAPFELAANLVTRRRHLQ